ncbi:unnamed protein product [Allacma fusca]|uniref:SSD domain-containing protein n=1 Tax=Allacma fusca TaxID=39272 RepID=A0A8J2PW44_9HEXA|nr:unnamed protein product [Allacma fusca]
MNSPDSPGTTKESWWSCGGCHCLAVLFSRFPFIVIFVTFLVSFLASWAGISSHGFPEFGDPYQGFMTRPTSMSRRLMTLDNLRTETRNLRIIENYPGERMTSVESRKRRSSKDDMSSYCSRNPEEGNSRIALEIEDSHILFSLDVIKRLCYFQKVVEGIPEYEVLCEKDGRRNCCPGWSLPNFIAMHANITECSDIKEEDVVRFHRELTCCMDTWGTQKDVPGNDTSRISSGCGGNRTALICGEGSFVRRALRYTLQKSANFSLNYTQASASYNSSSGVPKYAMLVLPIPKDPHMSSYLEDFMDSVANIRLPDYVVHLGGFSFGSKQEVFSHLLISDMKFVVVASVLIFFMICFFVRSIFITIISFGALTLSLGVSYFLYNSVFCIPYFPFMNMLVAIITLGIGTDGTLILSVAWRRCRNNLRDEPFNKQLKFALMKETLKETSSTLVITTCTTACAFYASMTSSIITIRCFSIFAGTSIIVSFVLLYFTVPTALLASEIIQMHISSLVPSPGENTLISKLLTITRKTKTWRTFFKQYICPWKFTVILHKLTATKLAIASLLVCTIMLSWGISTVFYYPGYELPKTEQFQLLSYNHPIEKYDRAIEPLFEDISELENNANLTFYFVWGLKATDNGAFLNPSDEGFLEFENLTLSNPENQQWMLTFCKKLKNQSFYDLEANMATGANFDSCMLDTMITWMDRECKPLPFLPSHEPCCNVSKFPYESHVFTKCIPLANRDLYRTSAAFFQPDIAGPKFFTMFANPESNEVEIEVDESYDNPTKKPKPIYSRMGQLATFTVRARTNFHYSISYDKMGTFYKVIDDFFNESLQSAPESMQKGFFMSSHFDFFDLQHSLLYDTWYSLLLSTGLCFVFIWISSRSFFVSLGAVASILAIVTVSSAILIQVFSWKLGVFEAIAVTVAVGLSDFTTHHSIEFAKRGSIAMMTSATFISALATVVMGLFMFLFSQVLVYQQIDYQTDNPFLTHVLHVAFTLLCMAINNDYLQNLVEN